MQPWSNHGDRWGRVILSHLLFPASFLDRLQSTVTRITSKALWQKDSLLKATSHILSYCMPFLPNSCPALRSLRSPSQAWTKLGHSTILPSTSPDFTLCKHSQQWYTCWTHSCASQSQCLNCSLRMNSLVCQPTFRFCIGKKPIHNIELFCTYFKHL